MRIPVLAASAVEPGVFYLSAEGEVYRSADDGQYWQKLAVEWDGDAGPAHAINMAVVEEHGLARNRSNATAATINRRWPHGTDRPFASFLVCVSEHRERHAHRDRCDRGR